MNILNNIVKLISMFCIYYLNICFVYFIDLIWLLAHYYFYAFNGFSYVNTIIWFCILHFTVQAYSHALTLSKHANMFTINYTSLVVIVCTLRELYSFSPLNIEYDLQWIAHPTTIWEYFVTVIISKSAAHC